VAALLTPDEMGRADQITIKAGTPGIVLMENAGRAVADTVSARHDTGASVTIIAGPGNNGGDGYVAARLLRQRGFQVRMTAFGNASAQTGDAATAAESWGGPTEQATGATVEGAEVVIDALFGAGLGRPIDGAAADLVEAINRCGADIIAVDLPSGVNGLTGEAMGAAIRAAVTVTFFRRKPGHLLMPGRTHCGRVEVADIGIHQSTLETIKPLAHENGPDLWRWAWSPPALDGHKYQRGHVVAVSGPMSSTGAGRLAAISALRAGAGLVTMASPPDALQINCAHLTAVMVRRMNGAEGLSEILADARLNSIVLGPGLGIGAHSRDLVAAALDGDRAVVLDADALTSFAEAPDDLFTLIARHPDRPVVLTPHAGEFTRLFGAAQDTSFKLQQARDAAAAAGATLVLKGADTIIADPDGRAAINENASAWLATAGSGDVLAGIIAGLLAQGLPGFEAAAMGVWLHGAAGQLAGPGLISEDLPAALHQVWADLVQNPSY